jgi:hypothetical protein
LVRLAAVWFASAAVGACAGFARWRSNCALLADVLIKVIIAAEDYPRADLGPAGGRCISRCSDATFAAAGISALADDHRSVGASDGPRRSHADADPHAEDYHDALIAAGRLSDVDLERVAIWGIRHGGGCAMMAAAAGTRAKSAALQRPIHSGPPPQLRRVDLDRRIGRL